MCGGMDVVLWSNSLIVGLDDYGSLMIMMMSHSLVGICQSFLYMNFNQFNS